MPMTYVIDEIRKYRDEYAARFNYDVKAMVDRPETPATGKRSPDRFTAPKANR
ncbi:MAG: hypothetical protein IH888_13435 [Planctomycetes bacterium]|nr:hypothetical protein [Planctomycetota bacterium]